MSGVTVRSYELRDIPAILALESVSAGAPQWGEAFWRGGLPGDVATHGVFVAEIEGQVCGYVVAAYAVKIAELQSVVVSASVRRCGVGWALCERAVRWSRKLEAQIIELEVRESNAAALSLYKRLGLVEQGRRTKYYRNPEEDAVLMAMTL